MGKWHYFIFSLLLVPRMKAHEENISELFEEIDEFFGKLTCPDGLISPNVGDVNEAHGEPNPNVDFETRMNAYVRYQLIKKLQDNPDIAMRCGSRSLLNKKTASYRTLGLITDIWRRKLCFIMGHCFEPRPYIPPSNFGESKDDKSTNIQILFPPSNAAPRQHVQPQPVQPQPEQQQHATCTPFEQNILLPSGKLEKQQLMNCLFPNQTSVIVHVPTIGNSPITTNPSNSPSTSGSNKGPKNISGNPDIVVIQDVKVNANSRKP